MADEHCFSGSYAVSDVEFLLKPVELDFTDASEKERLIQAGARHYSELLTEERAPDQTYFTLFEAAFERNHRRMAQDVVAVAGALAHRHPEGLVLVSLARAGTPVGVLLRRALGRLGVDAPHVSVSIIRDRGIDAVAMDAIRARWPNLPVRFVDGWTGKGAIARELKVAMKEYNTSRRTSLSDGLVVLSDLAGVAQLAASGDDYLIPSAILNAVVSGLVSRSVLSKEHVGEGDFHACFFHTELADQDRSRWFVDAVDAVASMLSPTVAIWTDADRTCRKVANETFMSRLMTELELEDRHRVKPGIGEATRAAMRREPACVLVRDRGHPDVQHLVHLASVRGFEIKERQEMPYGAATVTRILGGRHTAWVQST